MPTCRAQYAVVQPVAARLVGMAKFTTGAMTFSPNRSHPIVTGIEPQGRELMGSTTTSTLEVIDRGRCSGSHPAPFVWTVPHPVVR
jgi:hypothetical protein